jgi:hypothetical protein
MPGWPKTTQNIFSSAAVGDLDADGDFEIVMQEGEPGFYGNILHVWHHDGSYLDGWPIEVATQWESSRSNPAIADVDGDGTLEIVTVAHDSLRIFRADASIYPGYPRPIGGITISSPQVIDMDADGVEEIFLCYLYQAKHWVSGWKLGGTVLPGFPKLLFTGADLNSHSSAHIADIEGDGDLDLCAQGQSMSSGRLWVYEVNGSTFDPATSRADWPKIRRDLRNTGCFEPAIDTGVGPGAAKPIRITWAPNPVGMDGALRLRVEGAEGGESAAGSLVLYDLSGRRVGGAESLAGGSATLRVRDLFAGAPASGIYIMRWAGNAESGPARSGRLVVLGR